MSRAFKTLDSWKKAIDLSVFVYEISRNFPEHEIQGITSEIRRAVVSISNNIAEGTGVKYVGRYIFHLRIAIGSANEVENLTNIANRLGYISNDDFLCIENDLVSIRKLENSCMDL
jgi:four helix bundle protein